MEPVENLELSNYEAVRQDFVSLVSNLDRQTLDETVRATPAWTVLDVVRHVVHMAECTYRAGQPDLILTQWSPDSKAARKGSMLRDSWTAEGVSKRSGNDLDELLSEWTSTMELWHRNAGSQGLSDELPERAARLAELGGIQPAWWPTTKMAPPAMDLLNHEWDLRDTLEIESTRRSPAISAALDRSVGLSAARRQMAGLPMIAVDVENGRTLGDPESGLRVSGSEFELMRAFSGRRTPAQVEQLSWTGGESQYEIVNPWSEPTEPLAW